jgi:hypothetical protein
MGKYCLAATTGKLMPWKGCYFSGCKPQKRAEFCLIHFRTGLIVWIEQKHLTMQKYKSDFIILLFK